MSYTVLARRYRSQTFDEVVGQGAAAQTLKNAIATDRVAHAYLFTGTRGVGKTTMARILAKALNCQAFDEPTTQPCCKCESCKAINEGEDMDVLEIDGASHTGVDHIRELRQNAIYRPARARLLPRGRGLAGKRRERRRGRRAAGMRRRADAYAWRYVPDDSIPYAAAGKPRRTGGWQMCLGVEHESLYFAY